MNLWWVPLSPPEIGGCALLAGNNTLTWMRSICSYDYDSGLPVFIISCMFLIYPYMAIYQTIYRYTPDKCIHGITLILRFGDLKATWDCRSDSKLKP